MHVPSCFYVFCFASSWCWLLLPFSRNDFPTEKTEAIPVCVCVRCLLNRLSNHVVNRYRANHNWKKMMMPFNEGEIHYRLLRVPLYIFLKASSSSFSITEESIYIGWWKLRGKRRCQLTRSCHWAGELAGSIQFLNFFFLRGGPPYLPLSYGEEQQKKKKKKDRLRLAAGLSSSGSFLAAYW